MGRGMVEGGEEGSFFGSEWRVQIGTAVSLETLAGCLSTKAYTHIYTH